MAKGTSPEYEVSKCSNETCFSQSGSARHRLHWYHPVFRSVLAGIEQRRSEAVLETALSGYLSDSVVRDAHDWGTGRRVLIVLQREAQEPGMWRLRWLYPFDKRLRFAPSSLMTRCSFVLSNLFPGEHKLLLQLPRGVSFVSVNRTLLDKAASSNEFDARFPDNLGSIAVSRAGVNLSETEAIFYIDHFCGLCGGGRYVLMRKITGTWKVIDEHYTWIS